MEEEKKIIEIDWDTRIKTNPDFILREIGVESILVPVGEVGPLKTQCSHSMKHLRSCGRCSWKDAHLLMSGTRLWQSIHPTQKAMKISWKESWHMSCRVCS